MKRTIITIIFTMILMFTFLISCTDSSDNESKPVTEEMVQNETPEALEEKVDLSLKSYSKRTDYDIISRLYNEALEKNTKLNQINEEINGIHRNENDSLKPYLKYTATNNSYWISVKRIINNIQDSILMESTQETFELLEENYNSKMSLYEEKLQAINERSILLKDQLLLMKLFITAPMMNNYQVNEKPSIETLKNIIKEYDQLINKSEKFIK